ncbi:MAG: ATP-binding cassette domain-containing protein [Bacteroidota bacterium]|nr:ATP-binding cassette domain-containing protein [Bacteroidota bacterium]
MKWGQGLVMVITYISLAFLANYKFTFLVVGSSLLTNIFYRSLHKKIKLASYEISRTGHNLNAYMIEMIHYFKYLKSTNYLTSYSKKVKSIINIRQDINRKTGLYSAISTSIREPIIVLIVSLVIFIQLNLIGGSLGSIILSLLLFYRGLNYLLTIQKEWQSFILNSGAIQNVCEVSERMQELKEPGGNRKFEVINEKIILKNINLSYGNVKVLKNIEIFIPKKTTIALVGASGSGKTTLVNIISGLLKPDEGDVYIDNLSLQEYNLNTYRNKIGYISQEPVVFNDTIFNNITFWAEKNAENIKHFKEVIELASLKEFIDDLENKEDTYLGDHGILISGGQRQRISIARELFKNPEILILDEATSALDSETEKLIQENLDNLHGSYTMIVIAHRLSTIKKADIIYLMDKGEILDEGSYNDLLRSSKKFKHLVTLQQL